MSNDDDRDVPANLAQWGLHAFALGARSTPHAVIALDDNGSLLYHARGGATRAQLEAHGIAPTESQLALLRIYDLAVVDGDRITTAFPVVGPEVLTSLRPAVRRLATELVRRIADDVTEIGGELRHRGHPGHDYAVLFGHSIDGLLWDRLRARDLVPATGLDVERPFWNGAFWALYPPVAGAAGVNEFPGAAATLVAVWTAETRTALAQLVRSDAVRQLLAGPTGQTGIPVVAVDDGDLLHHHGLRVAETVADEIGTGASARSLLRSIPNASLQQAVVIVAHELIWAIMDALVASGRVQVPAPAVPTATLDSLSTRLLLRLHAPSAV